MDGMPPYFCQATDRHLEFLNVNDDENGETETGSCVEPVNCSEDDGDTLLCVFIPCNMAHVIVFGRAPHTF